MKKELLGLFILSLVLPLISSAPGIPNWFYGDVTVNGTSAPDNNIINATVNGQSYIGVTRNGKFGYDTNTFYVEDPIGDNAGKQIFFYVGRKPVENVNYFENGNYTKLDISLTTYCGDNYCLGTETCGNCDTDCGDCTTPPVITISSPEPKTYDTTNIIPLTAVSDQPLMIWMYSLDGNSFIPFTPDITLTLNNGNYTLTVLGINQVFQTGSSSVSFNVNVPYCGNGVCNAEESCSSCATDCGACSSSSSSSGSSGGSSSSSSGGGGAFVKPQNTTANTGVVNLGVEETPEENNDQLGETETQISDGKKGFFSGITGAVVGIGENLGSTKLVIIVVFVVGIIIVFAAIRINRRKNRYVSQF